MKRHHARHRRSPPRDEFIAAANTGQLRLAFENLIAAGYLIPTGEKRPSRKGTLQPVYVARETAIEMGLPVPPLIMNILDNSEPPHKELTRSRR